MKNEPLKRLCYICEATQGGVRKHVRDLLRVFLRGEEGFHILGIFGDRGEAGFRAGALDVRLYRLNRPA